MKQYVSTPFKIVGIDDNTYVLKCVDGNTYKESIEFTNSQYHPWTIEDTNDGDVLSYVTDEEDLWIMIYWSLYEPYEGHVYYHALLVNDNFFDKGTCCISIDNLKPATKEQYDLLFSKMKEAGYEWDANTKELKKIEQKSAEKTDALMSLDEAIRHCNEVAESIAASGCEKCAKEYKQLEKWLTELKELKEQKPTWSEEDSKNLNSVKWIIENSENLNRVFETIDSPKYIKKYFIDWLDYLKDRVQLQPKQEWSEEDEKMLNDIVVGLTSMEQLIFTHDVQGKTQIQGRIDWLKSLKPHWKPSEEQMEALEYAMAYVSKKEDFSVHEAIELLYNDLKTL